MPPFKNRILGVLDTMYGILGDKAPNDVETQTPIQLVHDVSREAEIGSGLGINSGYFWDEYSLTVDGVTHGSNNVWGKLLAGFIFEGAPPKVNEINIWFIAATAWLDGDNDITSLSAFLRFPVSTNPDLVNQAYIPVFWSDGATLVTSTFGSLEYIAYTPGGPTHFFEWASSGGRPLLIPRNTTMSVEGNSTAPNVVKMQYLYWIGAKGTAPPGMR